MPIHIERNETIPSIIEFAQLPDSLPEEYKKQKILLDLVISSSKPVSGETLAKISDVLDKHIYHIYVYVKESESYFLVLAKRFEDYCKAKGYDKVNIYLHCEYP